MGVFARLVDAGQQTPLATSSSPACAGLLNQTLSHPAVRGQRLRDRGGPAPAGRSVTKITTAMLLAAGLGTRMKPSPTRRLAADRGGRPHPAWIACWTSSIAQGVARRGQRPLSGADAGRAPQAARRDIEIVISDESGEVLETGGGVVKALPLLGDGPVLRGQHRRHLGDGGRYDICEDGRGLRSQHDGCAAAACRHGRDHGLSRRQAISISVPTAS